MLACQFLEFPSCCQWLLSIAWRIEAQLESDSEELVLELHDQIPMPL